MKIEEHQWMVQVIPNSKGIVQPFILAFRDPFVPGQARRFFPFWLERAPKDTDPASLPLTPRPKSRHPNLQTDGNWTRLPRREMSVNGQPCQLAEVSCERIKDGKLMLCKTDSELLWTMIPDVG